MGVFGRFAAAARSTGVWVMKSCQLSVQVLVQFGEIRAGINPAPTVLIAGEGFIPARWRIGA